MTTSPEQMRLRYLAEAVETASPAMRLVMLFDGLELDLARADAGFAAGDLKAISDHLIHAQEILLTLRDTLRPDLWDGATQLQALYSFFHAELLGANLDKDRERAARVATLVGQIAAAWRRAAEQAAADGTDLVPAAADGRA